MEQNAFNIPASLSRQRDSIRHGWSAGFSLVEVMVAMVIGTLGIIVMMQMFSVFEGQKRSTTGGDDAISSGAVSLYGIERAIQQSGWGIGAIQLIGCTVSGLSFAGSVDLPLVPVSINFPAITGLAGQDANTDTLLVISGNGNGALDGDAFSEAAAASATLYGVHTPTSFFLNDRVVAVPRIRPSPCALTVSRVSPAAPALSTTVNVTPGVALAFAPDDLLFNLGQAPSARAYAIRGGNLTVCDYTVANCGANNPGDWVPIASNVLSLRAQYGRDTSDAAPVSPSMTRMDGVVDVWDQRRLWDPAVWTAGSVSADPTKDTPACALLRVAAVRVALVARNSQPEKTVDWPALTQHVTPTAPLWSGSDAPAQAIDATAAAAVAITLPDPDPAWPRWQDFRDKTFQTVIPLRNITSQGAVFGC